MSSILVQSLCSAGSGFCATDNFLFTMFAQVLTKELECIFTNARKIFNCRVSFKILLSVCLIIVEKEL